MTDLDGCLKWMGDLERTLARLDTLPRKVAIIAAADITKSLQREFATGSNSYGQKWRKLATGKPSHLTETRKLRRGTKAVAMPGNRAGIRVKVGPKGIYHQTGTSRMPARKILPERGMPREWSAAMNRAMRQAFKEATR